MKNGVIIILTEQYEYSKELLLLIDLDFTNLTILKLNIYYEKCNVLLFYQSRYEYRRELLVN